VRLAQNDAHAFGALYDRYVQRIYRYCFYRTNNGHDAEDLTAQLAVPRTIDGDELIFPRAQVALAAAAVGAQAIDAVFTSLDDLTSLERDCTRARAVGFHGKMAIHPRQVPVINAAFTPSGAEIERARRVLDAYEAAPRRGQRNG